jgi:hypothetical protein
MREVMKEETRKIFKGGNKREFQVLSSLDRYFLTVELEGCNLAHYLHLFKLLLLNRVVLTTSGAPPPQIKGHAIRPWVVVLFLTMRGAAAYKA